MESYLGMLELHDGVAAPLSRTEGSVDVLAASVQQYLARLED